MIAFIDDHHDGYGVEPICKVLPIAPSTYYARVAQRRDPEKLSHRGRRDLELKPQIARVFAENFAVYGVRKVWRQMQREGFTVARCTVERLMREMGLQGVIRGKPVRTTVSDKAAPCPLDHVNRQFNAPAPKIVRRVVTKGRRWSSSTSTVSPLGSVISTALGSLTRRMSLDTGALFLRSTLLSGMALEPGS